MSTKMERTKTTISKREAEDLFYQIDNEGLGYYLTDYGPDIQLLSKLGFKQTDLEDLLSKLNQLKEACNELEGLF